jgi:DNA-binding PadR family transcriptional regulator
VARLSTTSYAVLGLLSFARMSGYDVAGVAQRSVAQIWPISKTQAYAELRRLAEAGLVAGRDAKHSGGPAKTIYELTPAGEAALDAWLEADTVGGVRLRAPALLKLLVGHRIAPSRTRAQLGDFRARVEERVAELRALTARLEANPDARYAWATALFGVRICEAILAWLDEVEPRLPKRRMGLDPRRADPAKATALLK